MVWKLDRLSRRGIGQLGALLDPEESGEAWEAASLEDRRAVMGLAVDRVIVATALRGGSPEGRITVEWSVRV